MKLNLEKLGKKNICLIGLMGAGKSVIGKLLAKELRIRHYDSDKLIEKKLNKSINQIFSDHGESYFRNIEEDIVLSLLDKKNCVISLGGGSILSYLTRKALFINSFTVYLIDILHYIKVSFVYVMREKCRFFYQHTSLLDQLPCFVQH